MKKMMHIVMLLLAINFIALAGGVGWLIQSGHLDRGRASEIRAILFPLPSPDPSKTAELQTESSSTTQPSNQLDAMLARYSGRTTVEQVELIQRAFDAQMAQLDRRERELADLKRQVDLASEQLSRDRVALDGREAELVKRQAQAVRLQSDQGFQDSLKLYSTMPAKQVKSIFMTLDDSTVIDYLQAMQPRIASKILREFKTADEISRVEKILEKMRLAQATIKE